MYERPVVKSVLSRIGTPHRLLQIITGPRQVGKTTAARQIADHFEGVARYASADALVPPDPAWIATAWERSRRDASSGPALLVLDEVQKVPGWSEVVKAHWDDDRHANVPLDVLLLGSSALMMARGTSESLAGRFLLHRCLHWSWPEMQEAFGWDLDTWLMFGGYPGAAPFIDDSILWRRYIVDSLIEPAVSRDVLALETITKPTLMRHLFATIAMIPCEIISYTKLLGQLVDAGNTTTLAHYLDILEHAYLVSGLQLYTGGRLRTRRSSPKIVLWNNALTTALTPYPLGNEQLDPVRRGRLVENAVGAHLLNHLQALPTRITYWRHRQDEVDFVIEDGRATVALEVKSGKHGRAAGLRAFEQRYPSSKHLILGTGGIPLEEVFSTDPTTLLR